MLSIHSMLIIFVLSIPIVISSLLSNVSLTPVDLRLDFLDDHIPKRYLKAFIRASRSKDPMSHQYADDDGQIRLLKAISNLYSMRINHTLTVEQNILVTVGGIEGVFAALKGLTNEKNEWIIMEPYWSRLVPLIKLAGGVPKYATLKLGKNLTTFNGNSYHFDKKELRRLFNNKTRGILFTNPHNPTGKVFTLKELQFIANLSNQYDTVVVSDEVNEWSVFKPYTHINLALLPGMFNRTITIGSAGKAFDLSGWRIGWAYGPSHLMQYLKDVHLNLVLSSPNPQQDAVAFALEEEFKNFGKPKSFFNTNLENMMLKRDFLIKALENVKFKTVRPNGGHCLIAKMPIFKNNLHNTTINDITGVLGMPLEKVYNDNNRNLGKNWMRYCYQKKNNTLVQAYWKFQLIKDSILV